ncbi:unnamed protein product [Brugia timori]|uniref:Transposase n=1 Tax=Brugia timori TaxID=42155 RepID=A0A0R3Q9I8_9BILA|nr:unnamed protein product [Brugia timori]
MPVIILDRSRTYRRNSVLYSIIGMHLGTQHVGPQEDVTLNFRFDAFVC